MLAELDKDLLSADDAACDVIDGVRVRWISPGRAARDETAFRHALSEGHRLHAAGNTMKDNLIIDAYEQAYAVAQAVGADNRVAEMPPMRDRQTMARRVRAYVINGKSNRARRPVEQQSRAGRKALATMGRKGGQKAAQRWENDPEEEYAQRELNKLHKANRRRAMSGELLETRVKMAILDARAQGVKDPSTKALAQELGVSVSRIKQLRQRLGLQAKRGRPKKG